MPKTKLEEGAIQADQVLVGPSAISEPIIRQSPEHLVPAKPGKSEQTSEESEHTPSVRGHRLDQMLARYRSRYEQHEKQLGNSPSPGIISQRIDARAAPPTLKEHLSALLYEGKRLEKQCLDEGSPLPIAPAEHWRRKTYALLEGQTAKYIADIYDEPGFEPLHDSYVRKKGPSSAEHRECWMPIAARVIRLENIFRMFENLD